MNEISNLPPTLKDRIFKVIAIIIGISIPLTLLVVTQGDIVILFGSALTVGIIGGSIKALGKAWAALITFVAILLFLVYWGGKVADRNFEESNEYANSESYSNQTTQAETYWCYDLISDYKANEVRADQKYRGRIIRVYGVVREIKRDMLNRIYVTVQPKLNEDILYGVQCYFDEYNADQAAELQIGRPITVEGQGGPANIFQPTMSHCKTID